MAKNMVDQISKILNQAERAEEGSPERELFMSRAMALSQAYSIDLAIARAHTVKKERVEVPEKRSFKVGQDRLKASKNAHFVDLMIAICDANDIEVTISGSNTYVFGVGMPSDLDMAERFFSLLAPQMIQEADAGLKRGDNGEWREGEPKRRRVEIPESERAWGQHDGSRDGHSEAYYHDEEDEDLIEDGQGGWLRNRTNWTTGRSEWVKSYPPPKFRNEIVTDEEGNVVTERKWVSVEDGRVWRVNFYQGFVNRARSRLREAKKQALKDGPASRSRTTATAGPSLSGTRRRRSVTCSRRRTVTSSPRAGPTAERRSPRTPTAVSWPGTRPGSGPPSATRGTSPVARGFSVTEANKIVERLQSAAGLEQEVTLSVHEIETLLFAMRRLVYQARRG